MGAKLNVANETSASATVMLANGETVKVSRQADGGVTLPAGHAAQGIHLDGASGRAAVVLTGRTAWNTRYQSWTTSKSLGAKVAAFVDGAANFLKSLGLSAAVAVALMGVLVASFAATTLDTACRLQRYVIQELATTLGGGTDAKTVSGPWAVLSSKHGATFVAVATAGAMVCGERRHRRPHPMAAVRRYQPAARRSRLHGHHLLDVAPQAAGLVHGRAHDLHAHPAGVGACVSNLCAGGWLRN